MQEATLMWGSAAGSWLSEDNGNNKLNFYRSGYMQQGAVLSTDSLHGGVKQVFLVITALVRSGV